MKVVYITKTLMFIISLYIFLFFSILHVALRTNKHIMKFAFYAASISFFALISLLLHTAVNPAIAIWFQRIQFSAFALINLTQWALFIMDENRQTTNTDIIVLILSLFYIIIPLIPSPYIIDINMQIAKTTNFANNSFIFFEAQPQLVVLIGNVFFLLCSLWILIKIIKQIKKEKLSIIIPLILMYAFYILAVLNDILLSQNLISSTYLSLYFVFLVLLYINLNSLKSFYSLFRRGTNQHLELEEKIKERSEEIFNLNKELSKTNEELSKQNHLLKDLAERDGLTGLLNHGSFKSRLEELISMSKRQDFPIVIAMVDIDNFKEINDNFGHQVGDEMLKTVSSLFKISLNRKQNVKKGCSERNFDIIGRYGGDEFAIAMPYISISGAQKVFDKIYEYLEMIGVDNYDGKVSLSIGAVSSESFSDANASQLIRYADEALYFAKAKGKNRYYIYNLINKEIMEKKK